MGDPADKKPRGSAASFPAQRIPIREVAPLKGECGFETAEELAMDIIQRTHRSPFAFVFNQCVYWGKRESKDGELGVAVERLSNCLPTFLYFQKNRITGEASYYIQVEREGALRIYREQISHSSTTNNDRFNNALRKIGAGLTFDGNTRQLSRFMDAYWFYDPNPNEVETIDFVGYSKEHKAYIFTDFAVVNGQRIMANEQDYFTLPNNLQVKTTQRQSHFHIGDIARHRGGELWLDDFKMAFSAKGLVSLAFWVGSFFAEQIRNRYGFYPFLEMSGEPGAGKSDILVFLWRLSGRDNYEGIEPTKASPVGRYRTFEQYANLPVVLMEGDRTNERGHQRSGTGLSEYKGLYNGRGMRVRGMNTGSNETHDVPFRAALVFAQNNPIMLEDKAMMERIIQVGWNKKHHTSAGYYADQRLRALDMDDLSSFITACLAKEQEFLKALETNYKAAKGRLSQVDIAINQRLHENFALLMGLMQSIKDADILPGLLPLDIDVFNELVQDLFIERHQVLAADSQIVTQFWDLVHFLQIQKKRLVNHSKSAQRIAISFPWLESQAGLEGQRMPDLIQLSKEIRLSKRFKFIKYGTVDSCLVDAKVSCYIFEANNGLEGWGE